MAILVQKQGGSLNRYRGIILALLVFISAAALGTIWFLANFERKKTEIQDHYSQAAVQNPLLAATRLLKALGQDAQSYLGRDLLINLPPTEDALFIYQQTGSLSPTSLDALRNWIMAGGHLIISPQNTLGIDEEPNQDDLAAFLAGVRRRYLNNDTEPCGCGSKDQPTDNDQAAPPSDPESEEETIPEILSFTLDNNQVSLDFSQYQVLEAGQLPATLRIDADNGEGAYLLQYRMGTGRLTVLENNTLFNNRRIGENDHGWLLSWLVRDNHKTWLLYSSNMDGIFTLLRRNLPQFLLSSIGLLLFTVWFWQYRIGPLRRPASKEQRNILAHIDAMGRFHWQFDQAASLIGRIRENSLLGWQRRLPGRGREEGRVDPEQVASLTGLDPAVVENALYREVTTEQDLIVVSRCLQQLERRQGQ